MNEVFKEVFNSHPKNSLFTISLAWAIRLIIAVTVISLIYQLVVKFFSLGNDSSDIIEKEDDKSDKSSEAIDGVDESIEQPSKDSDDLLGDSKVKFRFDDGEDSPLITINKD